MLTQWIAAATIAAGAAVYAAPATSVTVDGHKLECIDEPTADRTWSNTFRMAIDGQRITLRLSQTEGDPMYADECRENVESAREGLVCVSSGSHSFSAARPYSMFRLADAQRLHENVRYAFQSDCLADLKKARDGQICILGSFHNYLRLAARGGEVFGHYEERGDCERDLGKRPNPPDVEANQPPSEYDDTVWEGSWNYTWATGSLETKHETKTARLVLRKDHTASLTLGDTFDGRSTTESYHWKLGQSSDSQRRWPGPPGTIVPFRAVWLLPKDGIGFKTDLEIVEDGTLYLRGYGALQRR